MKSSRKIILLYLFTFIFIGCKQQTQPKEDKETIFVSIEPQKFFLDQIVGDNFEVKTIIPAGTNPESYDPTPALMMAISKSKMYFKVGLLGFESAWGNNLQKNNPNLQIIDCSKSVESMHSICKHEDPDPQNTGHEGADPHIWSSPGTALAMAKEMFNGIVQLDSTNRSVYTANFEKLTGIFNLTDSLIRQYLAKAPSKSFLIYHPSLSYFAQEYGLTQYSIEHEGKQPTPQHLKQLIDLGKAENIKVVFVQAEFDKKNAETLAKEIGAKVVPINLMSYNWESEMIKIAKSLALQNE